jgi:hypothetical protein
VLVASQSGHAAAPAAGSEDYELLMPYAGWISGRVGNNGGLCCSISDCRVVKWRIQSGRYQAFIATKDDRGFQKFPDAPNEWIDVPEETINRENNPTPWAIACWSAYRQMDNGYYCFFLPILT